MATYYDLVDDGLFVAGGATNNAAKLVAAAVAAAGKPMWLAAGDYYVAGAVINLSATIPAFRILGPGRIVYNLADLPLTINGEWGPETTVSALTPSATVGTDLQSPCTEITVPNASLFSYRDIVKIWCDQRYPYNDGTNNTAPWTAEIATILNLDVGSNLLRLNRLFDELVFQGRVASTNVRLRKMIYRPVELDVTIFCQQDTKVNGPSRQPAIRLIGTLRAKIKAKIQAASGAGIDEQSCAFTESQLELLDLFNGSGGVVTPAVFGYGMYPRYGSSYGLYTYVGNTGRHLFTTDFDDDDEAFSNANYIKHGALFYLKVRDGIATNATGTPFDTHEFCYYPTFENCEVRSMNLKTSTTGVNAFSHRAFSPTYINCIARAGDSGFDDSSGLYDFGQVGFARYINCIADGHSGAGFNLGRSGTAAVSSQVVEVYNCSAYGGQEGIQVQGGGKHYVKGFRAYAKNSTALWSPLRFNPSAGNSYLGSTLFEFEDLFFDFTGALGTLRGILLGTTGLRLTMRGKNLIYTGAYNRSGLIEFASAITSLDVEIMGDIRCYQARPAFIVGTLPSGARLFAPTYGPGLATAYGTVPDVGDASITPDHGTTPETLIWNTILTANRTVTMTTTNPTGTGRLYKGLRYKFIRTRFATGSTLTITGGTPATGFSSITLTAGAPGATLEFDGALWQRIS